MIDIGELTQEETRNLFVQCMEYLTTETLFSALNEQLAEDDKAELAALWEDQT
jgi:hypothetical protein